MADVFLSYARQERASAETVKAGLEKLGLSVFFDVDSLDGGDAFPDVLDREVKSAGAVVSLWSAHALTRPWVKIECRIAKDRGVLIPTAISALDPLHDVPAAFYDTQIIDLADYSGNAEDEGWRKLVRALARTLKRPHLLAHAVADAERQAQESPSLAAANEAAALKQEVEALRRELSVRSVTAAQAPAAAARSSGPKATMSKPAIMQGGDNTGLWLLLGVVWLGLAFASLSLWYLPTGPEMEPNFPTLFQLPGVYEGSNLIDKVPFVISYPDFAAALFLCIGAAFLATGGNLGRWSLVRAGLAMGTACGVLVILFYVLAAASDYGNGLGLALQAGLCLLVGAMAWVIGRFRSV